MTEARQKAEDVYYSALDLMAEGQLEKAVDAYRESLDIDPTFTEAMHGLARALQDLTTCSRIPAYLSSIRRKA